MNFLFVLVGLLMVFLAIPMIRGKVSPNHWYGFRVRRTLDNPDIWYPANAYAGKLLLIYGLVVAAAPIVITRLFPELSSDNMAWIMTFILLGGILILVLLSRRYMKTL